MGVNKGLASIGRSILAVILTGVLSLGVFGCAKPIAPQVLISEPSEKSNRLSGQLEEVSPPEVLQTLKQIIDAYDPQIRILSPRPGEVVDSTTVSVRFQVRGLPLFKDQQWGLGPHLHVFLDDEPYRAVYDLSEPLVLSDLAPGTHTLRVFAARPWHESFKNQGAFDQRTFHIFAQTPQKALDKNQPLLTYSRPQGTYGAEPIMLDFYLTNAPLHMIAQEDSQDEVADWRIRCTINGQSFVFDQWQAIYLKGFKPGQNWVQMELIDENGNLIENAFNNTVRVITYEPGGEDALSKLVRGELALQEVAGILDPTYVPPMKEVPQLEPTLPESTAPESEPLVEPLEPTQPEEQSPAADLPDAEAQPQAQQQAPDEEIETVPKPSRGESVNPELADDPEKATQSTPSMIESPDEATGKLAAPDEEEVLTRDRTFQEQQAKEELDQSTETRVEGQPAASDPKATVESLKDSVTSLEETVTETKQAVEEVKDSLEEVSPKIAPETETAQSRNLESAAENLKSAADELESSAEALEETLPQASVLPQSSPEQLEPAPTSNHLLKQFQQWRQQYQKSTIPNEIAPSLDEEPQPETQPIPQLTRETAPAESEEEGSPLGISPESGMPESRANRENASSGHLPDSSESDTSAENDVEKPDEQTPASPEQFLI